MPDSNLQGPALAALIAALMCLAAACAVTETAEPAKPATPQPTATATRTHDLPESRFAAKRFLARLTGDEQPELTYMMREASPNGNNRFVCDVYVHDNFWVWVEQGTGTIREYGSRTRSIDEPRPPTLTPGDLSPEMMEQVARQLAADIAGFVGGDLEALEPRHGSKGDDVMFFRWEDLSVTRGPYTPMTPFLQLGITTNGELINYANYIR